MNDGYDPESRALDKQIAELAGWKLVPLPRKDGTPSSIPYLQLVNHNGMAIGSANRSEHEAWKHVPPFSKSLAATYGLCESVFIDGACGVDLCRGQYSAWVDVGGTRYEVTDADGAKALALAVKTALEAVRENVV